MIPRVHEALGVPLPGTNGVLPTSPVGRDFRRLLDSLLTPRTERPAVETARLTVPGEPTPEPAGPTPSRGGAPRTGMPPRAGRAMPSRVAISRRQASAPPMTGKQELSAQIRRAAADLGVEPALSVAVARAESSLNPAARSPDGSSVGTFQVLPSTAAEMRRKFKSGVVARPQGSDDVALGVGYLRYLHDLFGKGAQLGHGRKALAVPDPAERQLFAVAAFNAGEGRVAEAQARAQRSGGDPTRFADIQQFLPSITRGYVARVAGYAIEEGGGPGANVRA